jgi:type IV pilus assembly protein PilW
MMTRSQQGLSLVELMVALAIGSFLVIAATQVYLDNKRSYLFQQGQSSNQGLGRMVQLLLDQQLARTGFRADPMNTESLESAFPSVSAGDGCPAFGAGQTYQEASSGTGICFRYQGSADGGDVDCLGNVIAAGTHVLSRISYVPSSTVGKGSLTCSVGGNSTTLIDGLADFTFFPVPDSTKDVLGLRYAALMASTAKLQDGVKSDTLKRWNDMTGASLDEDGHLYQIVQGSVTLRNLMP